MSIGLVSMFYNEEILAPLFLNHYSFVDDIHIIIDADSNDRTEEICRSFPCIIHKIQFPDMMNAGIKQMELNKVFASLITDWGIMVDADEFLFHAFFSIPTFLQRLPYRANSRISAWLWNVYRHVSDKDITLMQPPKHQRRHGDPNFEDWYNKHYIKSCIARPNQFSDFNIGCHDFNPDPSVPHLWGAHWKMADPELAIIRRIRNGRDRQSKVNREMNWQCHDFHITEEQIRAECKAHENDPLLF